MPTESVDNFLRRVFAVCGVPFNSIPVGELRDLLSGSIMCRWGKIAIVSQGQPVMEDEKTGRQHFSDFRRVYLNEC